MMPLVRPETAHLWSVDAHVKRKLDLANAAIGAVARPLLLQEAVRALDPDEASSAKQNKGSALDECLRVCMFVPPTSSSKQNKGSALVVKKTLDPLNVTETKLGVTLKHTDTLT